MNIIDTIQADQIEDGDQILYGDDPLENVRVLDDSDDTIIIEGFSNLTGGNEVYNLHFAETVYVWAV